MNWIGPTVKIGGLLIQDDPKWIDRLTHDMAYKRGYREARHPLPSLIGPIYHDPSMVLMYHADPNHRISPVITWYDSSLDLPMPSDHGVADYTQDFLD